MFRNALIILLSLVHFIFADEIMSLPKGWDDHSPIDTEGLLIKLPKYPEKENGLAGLAEIADKINILENDVHFRTRYHDKESYTKAIENFPKISDFMLQVDKLLTRKHLAEDLDKVSFSTPFSKTVSLIDISDAMATKTYYLVENNKINEAITTYMQMRNMSEKFKKDCPFLISYLIVQTMESNELTVADFLLQKVTTNTQRNRILQSLNKYALNKDTIKTIYKGELNFIHSLLEEIATGNLNTDELFLVIPGVDLSNQELEKWILKRVYNLSRLLFQPNKTFSKFIEDYNKQLNLIDASPANAIKAIDNIKMNQANSNFSWLSTNATGNFLHHIAKLNLTKFIPNIYKIQMDVDFVIVRDALRRYKADNGKLPKTLNQLTPKYLVKVPFDVFSPDKSQYQYEADIGLIWGIGTDGILEKIEDYNKDPENLFYSLNSNEYPHSFLN